MAELNFVDFGIIEPKIKALLEQVSAPLPYSDEYPAIPEETAEDINKSLMKDVDGLFRSVKSILDDLAVVFWNKQQEGSLNTDDVEELKESIIQIEEELMNCARIVNR